MDLDGEAPAKLIHSQERLASEWSNVLGRCVLLPVLNPKKSAIRLHSNSFSSSEPLTDGSHRTVLLCTQLITFSAVKGKKILGSYFQSQ